MKKYTNKASMTANVHVHYVKLALKKKEIRNLVLKVHFTPTEIT